jgi:hypothetical protein
MTRQEIEHQLLTLSLSDKAEIVQGLTKTLNMSGKGIIKTPGVCGREACITGTRMKSKLSIAPPIGIIVAMLTFLNSTSLNAQQTRDYGTTRRPRTCASRSAPSTGSLSVAKAIEYATCDAEGDITVPRPGHIYFMDIFSLQVSPPRPANVKDKVKYSPRINRSKPVYDIKARAISYSCTYIFSPTQRGKNCTTLGSTDSDSINSAGECYVDIADKWRCRLGVGTAFVQGPPPAN